MKPAFISLTLAATTLAQPVWKADENRSLDLFAEDTTLIRFILDAAPRDPHFEVLATPDGRNTVWVAPPDHVWHYGLWFSWKYINGVNFWETNPATGKQPGLNRIEDAAIDAEPDGDRAIIRYRELAFPDPDRPAVLEDSVVITIERPVDGRGPRVTWSVTTRALADVTLDRTPIPGEPGGRDWGGYGGFSWRAAKDFTDLRFTDGEGRRGIDIHRQHASWVDATGNLHGKPAGILTLDHPQNPGHPANWYLVNTADLPFWFANPALIQPKPITLTIGESFRHAYRLILHDGNRDQQHASEAAQEFARWPE